MQKIILPMTCLPEQPQYLNQQLRAFMKRSAYRPCSKIVWFCPGFHTRMKSLLSFSGRMQLLQTEIAILLHFREQSSLSQVASVGLKTPELQVLVRQTFLRAVWQAFLYSKGKWSLCDWCSQVPLQQDNELRSWQFPLKFHRNVKSSSYQKCREDREEGKINE